MRWKMLLIVVFSLLSCLSLVSIGWGLEWIQHVVDADQPGAFRIYASDIFTDNNKDFLVSASYQEGGNWTSWLISYRYPDWTKNYVYNWPGGSTAYLGDIAAGDIIPDITSEVVGGSEEAHQIIWMFAKTGYEPVIIENQSGCETLEIGDVNGNGLNDLIVNADSSHPAIFWLENGGSPEIWDKHDIDYDGVSGDVDDLSVQDWDDDGDLDVCVLWYQGDVYLYSNNGSGVFSEPTLLLNTSFSNIENIEIAKFNDDNYWDIAMGANNGGLRVYYGPNYTTSDTLSSSIAVAHWRGMDSEDMDYDGDIDLVVGDDSATGGVYWYENNLPGGWIQHYISGSIPGCKMVRIFDVDGDTDMDIAYAANWTDGSGQVGYIESQGLDNEGPHVYNLNPAEFATDVPVSTNIEFDIEDTLPGVKVSSIAVTVEGEDVSNHLVITPISAPHSYHVLYNPVSDFDPGQQVDVTIDADDLMGNSMDTYIYYFTCAVLSDLPLLYFTTSSLEEGVMLKWDIASAEPGVFNIYRAPVYDTKARAEIKLSPQNNAKDSQWVKLNQTPIAGSPPYSFLDSTAKLGCGYTYYLEFVPTGSNQEIIGESSICYNPEQTSFSLAQCYPNPVSDSITIDFSLAESGPATISLYDLTGRLVATMLAEELSAGRHSVTVDLDAWDLNNGLYIYQLQAGDYVASRKLVFSK